MEPPADAASKPARASQGRGKRAEESPADPAEEAARRERNAAKREEYHKKTGVWL